jgi:hypothetical protein
MVRICFSLLIWLMAALLLTACPAPTEEPDLVATQVAVERAAAATLTAEAQAQQLTTEVTPTPPDAPDATATPTPATDVPAATSTPTPVPPTAAPTPTPTPTQILAVVFPVDGSDGNLDLRGSFVQSNGGRNVLLPGIPEAQVSNPMIFRVRLPVRVEVFNSALSNEDGDGIANVTFTLNDPNGEDVYERVEETAPFCLWGGNDLNCPAPTFAELNYRWPGRNVPIENGFYQLETMINALDGSSTTWRWRFDIEHDGAVATDPPAEPVDLVLRPACGNYPTIPAGRPIDLLYGIWATRGYDRAVANEPYIQIDLTIDGQPISGERQLPPVADLPQAICGRDYDDSYWVYHTVRLDPLSPGQHNVRIVYSFTQTVQDGYGGTHSQPFTQQYVITAQ